MKELKFSDFNKQKYVNVLNPPEFYKLWSKS